APFDENIGNPFAELRPAGDLGEQFRVDAIGIGDSDESSSARMDCAVSDIATPSSTTFLNKRRTSA
ncbi:MAG: hypothetical protein WBE84_20205, partial [Xanthobacteraceae bacterium]